MAQELIKIRPETKRMLDGMKERQGLKSYDAAIQDLYITQTASRKSINAVQKKNIEKLMKQVRG